MQQRTYGRPRRTAFVGSRFATASVLTAAALLAGCTGSGHRSSSSNSPSAPGTAATSAHGAAAVVAGPGRVVVGRLTVTTPGSTRRITAQPGATSATQATMLRGMSVDFGVRFSRPVRLGPSGTLPGAGATLTRTYATALPVGAVAEFAYFNESLGGWQVVPSTLSPDRRILTAQVHHFSLWTDIAGSVTHGLGSFFDRRAKQPSCSGSVPSWVQDAVFLDDENAPLLWCIGRDPAHPDVFVAKVAVNRGYGISINTDTDPDWSWNSFLNRDGAGLVHDVLTDWNQTLSQEAAHLLTPGSQIVPGGSESDFGFTETQVREAAHAGVTLVSADDPDLTELLISMIIDQLTDQLPDDGPGRAAAYTAGLLTAVQCASGLTSAAKDHDWARLAGALTDCISGAQDSITHDLAGVLASQFKDLSPKQIAKRATVAAHALKIIAAAGIALEVGTYLSDTALNPAGRALSVFLKAPRASYGSYGPFHVGMSKAAVLDALGPGSYVSPITSTVSPSQCAQAWPKTPNKKEPWRGTAIIGDNGTLVGYTLGFGAKTDRGIHAGSTIGDVRRAYANDGTVVVGQSQAGFFAIVTSRAHPNESIGFSLDLAGVSNPSNSLPDNTKISSVYSIGTPDYTKGFDNPCQ